MPSSPARIGQLLPLALLSGACALVYQIAWTRDFRLVFGASTLASAAVIAIFIGGLGLGALKLGAWVDRARSPLRAYAALELGIALSAAATRLLLPLAMRAYVGLGGTVVLGLTLATLVRLGLAALVLAVPTVLMGGTLPALARAGLPADGDPARRGVALLYGVNTLGAVLGCLVATFILIERLGTNRTLLSAVVVNALVALAALLLARGRTEPPAPALARADDDEPAMYTPPAFVLAAAALVGFAFFLMEMVFYRMLVPLLGGTVYTFGLVLAVALLGTGLGGALYAPLARWASRPSGLATTCLLEALGLAVAYALGDRLAVLAVLLRPDGAAPLDRYLPGWLAITAIVLLPASIAAGVQFPLLVSLLGRGRAHVGRHVGLAYAWNTAGAIGGALAGGFGLMVWLTALGCWRLVVVMLVALGLAAIVLPWLRGERRWLGSALRVAMAAGALVLVLATTGPTAAWRHSPIGAGRVAREEVSTPERVDNFLRDARRGLAWDADGIESTVSINDADGYVFTTNGKVDGHCRYDAATQIMGGLLGALLHPTPRASLVIGLGSGSSAGWLAAVPEMTRVDAVELEPSMLEVARRCAVVNEHALDNPKLHVVLGDAREVLSVTPERYDIVFSEPSNPYRAGVASLYTREFYDRVLQHLKPGGMFLQWVQAYEIDEPAMRTIFATAATAFPYVETWQLERADLLLVGSAQPIVKDLEALRARAASEPFARALRQAWEVEDIEGVLAHFVARAEYARSIEAQHIDPLNTDDRPVVEFRFARTVGQSNSDGQKADTDAIMEMAAARGLGRPELVGAEVDWELVTLHQAEIPMLDGWSQNYLGQSSDDTHERVMFGRAWKHHEWSEALAQWDRRPREPLTRMEAMTVAETAVLAHDPRAHDWVERIAKSHPVEYHALRATMLAQDQHFAEALPELQLAIEGYRRAPWPSRDVMIDAISACDPMASDSALALRMAELLVQPFALDMMRDHRLNTLRWLLGWSEVTPRCRELLAPLEPFGDPDRRWTIARSLKYRAECYATTGDSRARQAREEYERLKAEEDGAASAAR